MWMHIPADSTCRLHFQPDILQATKRKGWCYDMNYGSKEIAAAAISMAMSKDRDAEKTLKIQYGDEGIKTAAADYGGDFANSVTKIIERAVVCAKREGVIRESHL